MSGKALLEDLKRAQHQPVALGDEEAIASEMRSTDALRTRVLIGAAHAVRDRSPLRLRHTPDGIPRLLSSLPMPVGERHPLGGVDVKPMRASPLTRPPVSSTWSTFCASSTSLSQQHRRATRAGRFLDPVGQRTLGHLAREQTCNNGYGDTSTARACTLGPYWAGACTPSGTLAAF
jgi:hypothetical protein